ncbi:hypothetical protein NDU88_003963 [Pleurodeles waltl]|uniref:Uncharacterized protein n=1 Tax=Pleurodeles waltl TaxID=8319 RepID=A0AAV7NIH6_PLEWA|nr:hypothetical protein NDU88_003963 [Pleurodeles waltl]
MQSNALPWITSFKKSQQWAQARRDGLYDMSIGGRDQIQSRDSDLEQRVVAVVDRPNTVPDRDRELLFLRSKLVDLEDRSCRDNVRSFGFPEHVEGVDVQTFLKETLPTLTGISFDPSMEFQRAHRLGPKRAEDSRRSRPIKSCLMRHTQARQLISTACTQGPFHADGYEIHVTADFSKETNERRNAF